MPPDAKCILTPAVADRRQQSFETDRRRGRTIPLCLELQHEVAKNGVMAMVAQQDETPNPEDGERVLRSFQEWMVQRAQKAATIHSIDRTGSSDRSNKHNTDCADAPSIAPPENVVEPSQRIRIERIAYARPSVARRVLRTGVRGFVLAVILGVVWLVGRDDRAREFMSTW